MSGADSDQFLRWLRKVNFSPRTGFDGLEAEYWYNSTVSFTSVADGGGWSTPHPAALPLGRTWYLLYRRVGWAQGQPGQVWKISPPPSFDPRIV
jgi:hypothetical protein